MYSKGSANHKVHLDPRKGTFEWATHQCLPPQGQNEPRHAFWHVYPFAGIRHDRLYQRSHLVSAVDLEHNISTA